MPCWDGLLRLEEGGLSISELVYMLTQHYFGMGMLLWHGDGYFSCFAGSEVRRQTMKGTTVDANSSVCALSF